MTGDRDTKFWLRIAVGGLFAIGVALNLLHRQRFDAALDAVAAVLFVIVALRRRRADNDHRT